MLSVALTGGPSRAGEPREKPLVVASIRPLALMAGDLAGDWLRVETLLAPDQEPHHVSLTFSQRRQLEKADLILWVGPELESFLEKLLEDPDPDRVLGFRDAIADSAIPLQRADAHYWLHPRLAADYYRALAERLQARFPQKAATVQRRLGENLAVLARLEAAIGERMQRHASRSLIVDHQAYSYFADYFGLQIAGALTDENGVAMGPRTVTSLAGRDGIACLVVEALPAGRRAARMAEALGVPVVAVDPLGTAVATGQGYGGLLESVAGGFEACFAGGD